MSLTFNVADASYSIVIMFVSLCTTEAATHMDSEQGYYLDTRMNPCSEICFVAEVQRTSILCQKMCPDWFPHLPTPPQPTPITENVTERGIRATTSNSPCLSTSSYVTDSAITIGLSLGGLVVATFLIAVIICIFGQRLKKALMNILINRNCTWMCTRRGIPPHDDVQETVSGHTVPSAPLMEDTSTRDY